MCNKSSTLPKIPLECLRDEILEAGVIWGSQAFVLPALMGTGSSFSAQSTLEWFKVAKLVMNQKIPSSCFRQRKDKSCSPAQQGRAGEDHPSVLLQLPLAPRGQLEKLWFLCILAHQGFIMPWMTLAPSLTPPLGSCLDDSFHHLTGGQFQTPTNIC